MKTSILDKNVAALADAFDKLNVKAEKYNTEKLSFKVISEPYRPEYCNELHVDVEINGAVPKVGKYKLICVLEWLSDGQNLLKVVPGETVPEKYRETNFYCDHCKTNRYRKEVVVCQNTETGEYVQLGKNCLKDYLGIDLERLVNRFSWILDFVKELKDTEYTYGGRISYSADKVSLIQHCSKIIRKIGFASKKQTEDSGMSTSYLVGEVVFGTRNKYVNQLIDEHDLHNIEEVDVELANKALEWIANVDDSNSDYFYNLKAILKADRINEKYFGFVASLIPAYNRTMEYEAEKNKKSNIVSEYVGEVKKRMTFEDVECVFTRVIDTAYGTSTLIKFSYNGNTLTWFASGLIETYNKGDKYTIIGTVKKHEEYEGRKQTLINRVKLV